MLMSPPPGYTTAANGPAAQSMQLLGNQQNSPQMIHMLMQQSAQGGFGGHGMAGPTMGPVQQGPLGTSPQPNQGFR